MTREDLFKLIQTEIQAVAFDSLKEKTLKEKTKSTDDYMNSRSLTDADVDHILFHGGAQQEKFNINDRVALKENAEPTLKITTTEIKDFEKSFEEIMKNIPGASIVFDKQANGYSIVATKRADGVEAKASGIINLGDKGKVIWSYSILNGFNINAQNLKLSQSNKGMFEALANHYDDWQKNWREKLNLPSAPENPSEPAAQGNSLPGADMAPPDQSAPPVSASGSPSPAAPVA
jgi:hypothetical protein